MHIIEESYLQTFSHSLTRSKKTYVTILATVTTLNDYKKYLSSDQKYETLQDAYDAYEKLLTEGKYVEYKDTLPKL